MYYYRSEYWVVVRGIVKVIVGDREFFFCFGESIFILVGVKYCFENFGKVVLEVIEI